MKRIHIFHRLLPLLIVGIAMNSVATAQTLPDTLEQFENTLATMFQDLQVQKLGESALDYFKKNDIIEKIRQKRIDAIIEDPHNGGLLEELLKTWGKIVVSEEVGNLPYSECLSGDCLNDRGTYLFYDYKLPYVYVGDFRNGKFHGKGCLMVILDDKLNLVYLGELANGKAEGVGQSWETITYMTGHWLIGREKSAYRNGKTYIGQFQEGLRHGKGWHLQDKTPIYVGDYRYGLRQGEGVSYTALGAKEYVGSWEKDLYEGYGTLYHPNHQIAYEGTWMAGKKHGRGRSYFASGKLEHVGEWEHGLENGEAKLYYENGTERFQGIFMHGRDHGDGTYHAQSGESFTGSWGYDYRRMRAATAVGTATVNGRTRKIQHYQLAQPYDCQQKPIVMLEMNLVSGIFTKYRMDGARLTHSPGQFGLVNYGLRAYAPGPRLSKWGRLLPFAFVESRSCTFDTAVAQMIFVEDNLTTHPTDAVMYHQLIATPGDNAAMRQAAILVSKDVGLGLTVSLPRKRTLHDLSFGMVLFRNANVRFSKTPFAADTLTTRLRAFHSVVNYSRVPDFFLEYGITAMFLRTSIRLGLRAPTLSNPNFPIYALQEGNFAKFPLGDNQWRVQFGLNFSLRYPISILRKDMLSNKEKLLPFPLRLPSGSAAWWIPKER